MIIFYLNKYVFYLFTSVNFCCADGRGEIYFVDRDNCIFTAPDLEFKDKTDLMVNLKETLLDGVSC